MTRQRFEHMALDSTSHRFVPQKIISLIQNLNNAGASTAGTEPPVLLPALPPAEER